MAMRSPSTAARPSTMRLNPPGSDAARSRLTPARAVALLAVLDPTRTIRPSSSADTATDTAWGRWSSVTVRRYVVGPKLAISSRILSSATGMLTGVSLGRVLHYLRAEPAMGEIGADDLDRIPKVVHITERVGAARIPDESQQFDRQL